MKTEMEFLKHLLDTADEAPDAILEDDNKLDEYYEQKRKDFFGSLPHKHKHEQGN